MVALPSTCPLVLSSQCHVQGSICFVLLVLLHPPFPCPDSLKAQPVGYCSNLQLLPACIGRRHSRTRSSSTALLRAPRLDIRRPQRSAHSRRARKQDRHGRNQVQHERSNAKGSVASTALFNRRGFLVFRVVFKLEIARVVGRAGFVACTEASAGFRRGRGGSGSLTVRHPLLRPRIAVNGNHALAPLISPHSLLAFSPLTYPFAKCPPSSRLSHHLLCCIRIPRLQRPPPVPSLLPLGPPRTSICNDTGGRG